MALSFYAPVIFVKDIGASTRFYKEILNQEIEHDFGANIIFKSRLSLWQISPDHEIGSIRNSAKKGNTFELYFETEEILNSSEKIKSAGVKMLHDLKTEPWGQQTVRFFDPDNHLIEIGEAMHAFVDRIYRETGSMEETAKRMGVTIDKVNAIITETNT